MYMKYSISNNDNKSLNNYQINNRPSSLINSHSMNRRKFNSISENNHPKNKKKFHNGSISSSLRYKKLNYNHSSQLLPLNNEFRISNDKRNINMNNTSLFPYINMNKSNSENQNNNSNNREASTFYLNNNNINNNNYSNSNFILNKPIKIMKNPQVFDSKFKLEENLILNQANNRPKYLIKTPNDLKIYQEKLLHESKNKSRISKSQENISIKEEKVIPNSKKNSAINKNRDKNDKRQSLYNSINSVHNSSINSDEEKNFQTIDLNGVVTKVMTKLPLDDDINNKKSHDEKVDYHSIMKHPFELESYGYDFLRNSKDQIKIYKNPFDDKKLIYNIHNLIINPNTKKFRNDNLIFGSAFYKKKNNNKIIKNYKLLSKKGFQKLKKTVMRNLKKNVEDNILYMKRIKGNLNILMEKNIKKFKEHREELINDEL